MNTIDEIGFYTLTEDRITRNISQSVLELPISRAEIILTDKCNFKCEYCQGIRSDFAGSLDFTEAQNIVQTILASGLKNVRFSGGEPTLFAGLYLLIRECQRGGCERIAISTNGSGRISAYELLIDGGVNDFSISLDSRHEEIGDKMAGLPGAWRKAVDTIIELSTRTYVTAGMVFTEANISDVVDSVSFVSDLGVADIRIITAAQYDKAMPYLEQIPAHILDRHPILKYRVENYRNGKNVRGIGPEDTHNCPLVLDDLVTVKDAHFPCVIYMRQGGDPIGKITDKDWRKKRLEWFIKQDTHSDPICRHNCLDVCVEYNNRYTHRCYWGKRLKKFTFGEE